MQADFINSHDKLGKETKIQILIANMKIARHII